jgi:hypothetical protein
MSKIDTLIVCGDSFQVPGAINNGHEGTHWSEIVSARLGLNLLNLANKGCSSVAIAIQMLHAENVPNSIVVGSVAASEQRVEISADPWYAAEQVPTVNNFNYGTYRSHPLGKSRIEQDRHIRSVPILNLPEDEQRLFLSWISFSLKIQTDYFAIMYALRKIRHCNIPVLFFQGKFPIQGKPSKIAMEEFEPFIEKYCIIPVSEMNIFDHYVDVSRMSPEEAAKVDPGYHTSHERQVEIADYMTEKIKKAIQLQTK